MKRKKAASRKTADPQASDWLAVKHILAYLAGTTDYGLRFKKPRRSSAEIIGFSDSDWAGCVRTRKSTSGGALMRGSHVLRTWCGTQATVALSSAEAELIAAVRGAAEGLASEEWAEA